MPAVKTTESSPEVNPDVTVVIPNLNGGQMLAATVSALAGAVGRRTWELVVVDNGSQDESLSLAEAKLMEIGLMPDIGVRIIRNSTNRGFAPACNQGAAAASGLFILLLNSDCSLPPGSLDALISVAEVEPSVGAWQPTILSGAGDLDSAGSAMTGTGFLWHDRVLPAVEPATHPIFAAKGACLLIRRSLYQRIGGFPDHYFAYFEDTDLCWRVWLSGHEVRLVPSVQVRHLGGATTVRFFSPAEIDFLSFRNRLFSLLANAEPRTLARMLPLHLLSCLGTAGSFLIVRKPASAVAILRALAATISGWSLVLEQRRLVNTRIRMVPDSRFLRPPLIQKMDLRRAADLLQAYLPRW